MVTDYRLFFRTILWAVPFVILAFLLGQSHNVHRRHQLLIAEIIESRSRHTAQQIFLRLDLLFFERTKDIAHLATIIEQDGLQQTKRFVHDASGIMEREKTYKNIGFFSPRGQLLLAVTQNEDTYLDLVGSREIRQALQDTMVFLSAPRKIADTLFTAAILVPVKGMGVVAAMVDISGIVSQTVALSTPVPMVDVVITVDNTRIFGEESGTGSGNQIPDYLSVSVSQHLMGLEWEILVTYPVRGRYLRLMRENRNRYIVTQVLLILAAGLFILSLFTVTKAKSSEMQLVLSEKRYRRLTENARDMIFRYNCRGKRFEYVSPASEGLTGYPPWDFYNNRDILKGMVAPEWKEYGGQRWRKMVESGEVAPVYEFRIITKSEESKWVHLHAVVVYDHEGILRDIEGIVTDITELKTALEDREKLIGELEVKNGELERFAYTISHELKTPLVTIRGFLGYLVKEALEGDFGGFNKDISLIRTATDTMNRLLEGLIELTRVGHSMAEPERIDFAALAVEVGDKLKTELEQKGIELLIVYDMPQVYGNQQELRELLENLIENGIKFSGASPDPLIEVGWFRKGEETWFFVQDNGIGIERKYQERIFGIFNKLEPSSEGAGVGLALVRRIVASHGGQIRVQSAGRGKGCRFEFTLPLA